MIIFSFVTLCHVQECVHDLWYDGFVTQFVLQLSVIGNEMVKAFAVYGKHRFVVIHFANN